VIYRLGSALVVPYVDLAVLKEYISSNSVLGLLNIMTGNNFSNFSIFAMGITPFITAQIIIQLLTMAIPYLENLSKEGEDGRQKIAGYTRYLAMALAIVQALGMTLGFRQLLIQSGFYVVTLVTTVICAGTAFLMWIGEQMTERGLGNGVSTIIFVSILSGIPTAIGNTYAGVRDGTFPIYIVIVVLLFIFLSVIGVVAIQEGTRKIPVQYAKRVVGRKVYGGKNTNLPLKVNQAGVIPIIFAQTFALFPSQLASFFPNSKALVAIASFTALNKPWMIVIYALMIIGFTFFYTMISFNPEEVVNNLQQYGGFVPGIRPGKPTLTYLTRILNRLTLSGSMFLAIIAALPIIAAIMMGSSSSSNALQFTGTSVLIVVGVALELVQQLEQHLIMRNYRGFLK
jgi:preprotein translocase subunit SecY